jgi:hypothetical protein
VNRVAVAIVLAFFAPLVLQGCGYHNPYLANIEPEQAPAVIYLTVWTNQTNELDLEGLIFRETADWLEQSRHLRLTKDREKADYLLTGAILAVDYPAVAYSVTDVATTLRASVTTSYELTDRATGATIWRVTETVRETNYRAGANAVRSRSNKRTALATIAEELGEQIYLRLTTTLTRSPGK